MAIDTAPTFGQLLRRYRLAAALSQEALAEQAGLSARGIADLERGVRRFPFPETLKRLVDNLGLTDHQRAAFIEAGSRPRPTPEPSVRLIASTIPVPQTSFVGREQDLVDLTQGLSKTRLLTLTGPGGVGKTRLALALAGDVSVLHPDGVWFVDLAPLVDPGLLVSSVATALGIRERSGRALADVVCDRIANRSVLLILDNCEHLLPECTLFVEQLLSQCESARIVVTSREALRSGAEMRWVVPPLRAPNPGTELSPDALANYGATRLFLERAEALAPGLEIDPQRARSIAHICRQLDGIPLAIELAAARVTMFSVEQIAARIDRSFPLLSSGARTAPPRQQTLRATIDWSYGLLSASDSLLLNRLSTFAGGWTFEAAEAVAGGDGIQADEILRLLGGLVDRSLVVAEFGSGGTVRYRLLQVVRQYGQQRMTELGQLESARRKHANYYLKYAQQAEPLILGPGRKAILDALQLELDNFRAAHRYFMDTAATEEALQLGGALYRLWMYRGFAAEGRASLREALALPGGSLAARAKALFCAGGLGVTMIQSDYVLSRRQLDESLTLFREIGDTRGSAWALMGAGAASTVDGDLEAAADLLVDARNVSQACGDRAVLALSLAWSADLAYLRADFTSARSLAEQALDVADSAGFAIPACMALATLGNLEWREGAVDAAERLLESSLDRAEELDEAYPIVRAAISLALLSAEKGRLESARSLLARSVTLALDAGNRHHLAQAFEGLAAFAALIRESPFALRFAGAATSVRNAIGTPLTGTESDVFARRLQPARRRLDAATADGAFSEGQVWSIEQATRMGLEFAGSTPRRAERNPAAGLTARERDVAVLVARGLSNREIANELIINEKTAKNHVQHVLEKIGVNSRRQIMARANELGLTL